MKPIRTRRYSPVLFSSLILLCMLACKVGYYEDFPIQLPTAQATSAIRPTSTTLLQATTTPRATPSGNYCEDATSAGARTRYTFSEILPCLDTIEEVSEFMQNNMMYDSAWDIRERGGNEYVPAWLVYERGVDDCDGHAILQCYFLEMNGRDAVMLGLNADRNDGHNVCAVDTGEAIWVLDDMGAVVGPFDSIEEAALHYISADGSLGTLHASQVTQITSDTTTPSVLTLPWNMIWKSSTPTP